MLATNRLQKVLCGVGILAIFPGLSLGTSPIAGFGLQQAGRLLADPTLFLYEFQRNAESSSPLPPGKNLGFQTHLLGGILILPLPDLTSVGNITAKVRLHPESRRIPGFPQVDLFGGYWGLLLAPLVETDDGITDLHVNGGYFGLTMASSVEPRTRLFWSYKFTRLGVQIALAEAGDVLGQSVQGFRTALFEHTFSAGIEMAYRKKSRWIFQGDYGFRTRAVSARVSWYHRIFEFGFNFYPESVFIMQPQLNLHANF